MRHLNAWQWALIAVFAVNALVTVLLIGKERKPITPGAAIVVIVTNAVLCYLVVMA